jgi:hypothetical protein
MSTNTDPAIREAERGDAQQIAALLTQLGYPSTSNSSGRFLKPLGDRNVSSSSLELRFQQ